MQMIVQKIEKNNQSIKNNKLKERNQLNELIKR